VHLSFEHPCYYLPRRSIKSKPYSLSDFFTFSQSNFHKFQTIGPLEYPETCFHNPTQAYCLNNYPVDPDNDANESD
jgi:hypothetical protein